MKTLDQINLKGRRVVIRSDLNVPIGDREVISDSHILDIWQDSAARLAQIIQDDGTVIWNGSLGGFEPIQTGTEAIAKDLAECEGATLANGRDTIAAIEKFGVADDVDYISAAGGAFLEHMEGKELPALEARHVEGLL